MSVEIERKFLVHKYLWDAIEKPHGLECKQTYIQNNPEKTVRARTLGTKGFITLKGKQEGISRREFEYEIPYQDAIEMIALFGEMVIEKIRYIIPFGNHNWEVDVFSGDNEGLIVAEIELQSDSENFEIPSWIAKEVSDDYRYINSNLQSHPFKNWGTQKSI